MAVVVQWDNAEKQILHFETHGHWTPEEFHEALLKLRQIVAHTKHKPRGILFSPNGVAPTGLFPLLRIGLRFSEDMNLPCVVISPAEFGERFYEILTEYYPLESLRFANSLDQGRDLLKTSDTS
jgi:hypothetical protein